jgi:uncharacterized protein YjbI with pentapeptide repeats
VLKVKRRRIEQAFGAVALVMAAAVVVGFAIYIVNAEGAARVSALFAGGLVLVGVWLLLWGYVRRPPPGQDDDFLDKLLAGAGQALLLGAALSFGFGAVGQRLEAEQKAREENRAEIQAALALRRDLAGQVRADAGGKSFVGVDLQGEQFRGLNMSDFDLLDANLTGADLTLADLTGANLSGADLTGADLSLADLTGAKLADADLTDADLTFANLTYADLPLANLTGATLAGTDLTGAFLTRADLTGAILSGRRPQLPRSADDLPAANLSGADLTGAILTGADLTGTRYDATTRWPGGFEPPPSAQLVDD